MRPLFSPLLRKRTEIVRASGEKVRLLDAVDVITGVSGGSFTALAQGVYGDKLFTDYEQCFLKRDVQGELIARALDPAYWWKLGPTDRGRSEQARSCHLLKHVPYKAHRNLRRRPGRHPNASRPGLRSRSCSSGRSVWLTAEGCARRCRVNATPSGCREAARPDRRAGRIHG